MSQNTPDVEYLIDEVLGYPDLSANASLADQLIEALTELQGHRRGLKHVQQTILNGAHYRELYSWARNLNVV